MRCAELLLAIVAADGPKAPAVHESGLESGLRLVVAEPAAGTSSTEVAAAFVLACGWANDSARPGSGLAALAAQFATTELEGPPVWTADVLPTRTVFTASIALDALESQLATLAKRLSADGVDEERFNSVAKLRASAPVSAIDRFREAAWPTSRLGDRPGGTGGAGDATALNRDALKLFLLQRCGCEGALLVLVGSTPASSLELTAGRAFASFPRARGVAPVAALEPFPQRPRRVVAPAGSADRLIGFRLPWREDPQGDGVAFARAWLEGIAGRRAVAFESSLQGAIVAYAADDEAGAARLREGFLECIDQLASARALPSSSFAAALDRLDAAVASASATPPGLARLLADGAAEGGDPLAPFRRRRRFEAGGPEAALAALRGLLVPHGLIEVGPRPAPAPAAPGPAREP